MWGFFLNLRKSGTFFLMAPIFRGQIQLSIFKGSES